MYQILPMGKNIHSEKQQEKIDRLLNFLYTNNGKHKEEEIKMHTIYNIKIIKYHILNLRGERHVQENL